MLLEPTRAILFMSEVCLGSMTYSKVLFIYFKVKPVPWLLTKTLKMVWLSMSSLVFLNTQSC